MPSDESIPQMRLYREWLEREYGLRFADYAALWQWSTTDLAGFWRSIWDYHQLESPTPFTSVVDGESMPGATWFVGAQVNYAHEVFRHVELAEAAGVPAIVAENEQGEVTEISWKELQITNRIAGTGTAPPWRWPGRSGRGLSSQHS